MEELMLSNCSAREDLWVPCTARRSESILKEINPEYSLEGLKLKLQNSGHLMQRVNLLEITLMLGKTEGRGQGMTENNWLNEHDFEQTQGDGAGHEKPDMLQSTGSQRVGHDLATEQQHSTQ